jgi:hypothetical protein
VDEVLVQGVSSHRLHWPLEVACGNKQSH